MGISERDYMRRPQTSSSRPSRSSMHHTPQNPDSPRAAFSIPGLSTLRILLLGIFWLMEKAAFALLAVVTLRCVLSFFVTDWDLLTYRPAYLAWDFLLTVTEPVLQPIRGILPNQGLMESPQNPGLFWDLSPAALWVAVVIATGILYRIKTSLEMY